MVLGDILPDREGVLYVTCLSSGMDYCVRVVVATDSEQNLGTLETEEGMQWICQMLLSRTSRNCFLYSISRFALRLQYAYNI